MTWRLPAEWEPQEAIWLVWPRDETTWPGEHLAGARTAFVMAMQALAPQPVKLLAHPNTAPGAEQATANLANVQVVTGQHVDSWIRDYGPLTVVDGTRRMFLKFKFDAWGEKYETLMADDGVVPRLVADGHMPGVTQIPEILEGGAVETDGEGTFLATESVALGRGQSIQQHEEILRTNFGAQRVIWLKDGIAGDDTDGHIDTITRFVAPGVVVTATAPPGHPDYESLAANLETLEQARDAAGRTLQIHELPAAPSVNTDDGEPLPAGYANFLIGEHAVLVPSFGHGNDETARTLLGSLFPSRRVVSIPHEDLIWGFGGIHCLSMQIPA